MKTSEEILKQELDRIGTNGIVGSNNYHACIASIKSFARQEIKKHLDIAADNLQDNCENNNVSELLKLFMVADLRSTPIILSESVSPLPVSAPEKEGKCPTCQGHGELSMLPGIKAFKVLFDELADEHEALQSRYDKLEGAFEELLSHYIKHMNPLKPTSIKKYWHAEAGIETLK